MGSFDVPFGVLAFDDSGVGARFPRGQEPADKFADGVAPEPPDGVVAVRGEKRPAGRWSGGKYVVPRRTRHGPGRGRRGWRRLASGCGSRSGSTGDPRSPGSVSYTHLRAHE